MAADLTTANLGDIAVSDQKSNAPHPQMTGAEEPDRVSRLYTPKRCVTANSPAVAEEQNQIRRVEAAVPAHAILQKPIDLIVQVRLPGSSVLGESIADWPCHKKPGEASNDSGEIPVFFPISPKTGLLAAAKLRVEVMPGDFIVRGRSKAELEVPPEGNSKIVFFSLIPTKSGKCHIHVQIFTLKGDYLGTLPMLTNVNGSSAESGSKVRLELWIHVSSDGVVEPIQKPRINPVMQQTMLKTLRDEPGQLLLNELIRVYHEASAIHELLHRAGLSVCYVVPSGQTVAILWQLIAEQIDSGRVKNGFDKLLAQVQQEYPGNAMFHKYAVMPEVRVGAEKAFNSDFLNKRVSEADVIDLLSATPSVKLEDYRVVGQYYRYQSKVATSLRKAAHKIVEDCRKGIGLYHNFLIWGFSGEGKTYFARQVAAEAGIACGEISLASATEVPDEATLKRHLAAAQAKGGPYLFIVDEIDKRTEDPWIYPGLFYSLSSRAANPNGNTVFVLIGSTGESLDVFWEEMERKKGGPDLKTRIPHDQVIIIPPTILGDRLLVVLSEIRKQGVQKSLSIKRIDKLALAYLLLSPNATPRGIEGMVMKAIERLVSGGGDTELSYGHFFDFGDVGQTKFITQYPSVHTALHEDSLRFD